MAGKSKGRSRRQQHVQTAFNAKRQRGFPDAQSEYLKPSQDAPRLTMQQEARNTGRHAISSSSLRHHQVSFVSAGNMRRDDDQDDSALETVNQSLKELNTTSSKLEPAAREGNNAESQNLPGHASSEVDMPEARSPLGQQSQASENGPRATQNDIFFIDLIGNKPNNGTGQSKPEIRPCSPTPTDSSEDEVVFVGRNNKSKSRQFPPDESAYSETPPTQYMTGTNCNVQDIKHQPSENPQIDEAKTLAESILSNLPGDEDLGVGEDSEINIDFGSKSRRTRRRGRRARQRRQETNEEELLLADYIANMQNEESSEDQSGDALMPDQPVPNTDGVNCKSSAAVSQDEILGGHVQHSLSWSSNDFDDLGDLSTSDDVPAEVGRIFSRRRRGVEVQYLVTGEDQVPDEARWILKEHLLMTGAGEQITAFDEKARFRSGFNSEGSDSSSSDHELDEELAEAEDEDFASGPNREKMSDEQFARILDRQEKFGLAADDMDWGQEFGDFDSDGRPDPGFQLGRSSGKKKRNNKAQFPSAAAFADALDQDPYRGFDIMDYDRPSLRGKPKRGGRALDYDLSDSDMGWELQQAWENDRTKKKVKKRERDELRALGLLGKQGKMNAGGKYSDPMTTDDIKYKIKAFLLSPSESLSLPPMDKKDRKLVHDLAEAVSLKSQSRGSGMSRFPMLYKKARTPSFDRKSIGDVDRIFSSGRFMRRTGGKKGFGGGTGKPVKPQRSGASAAASYMDGDVVGASAPEIGVENRGRAMLEKMGWSTGTALGATDNKGILKPLAQVVKNTKAGLG